MWLLSTAAATRCCCKPKQTAINRLKAKRGVNLNYANEWQHERGSQRSPSSQPAVSSQPRDVTLLLDVRGQLIEVEINEAFSGGL